MRNSFIGTNVHKGSIDGNLVTYDYYFNTVVFHLYVNHRVAQKTNIKSTWDYNKSEYHDYDRYDFAVKSVEYPTFDSLFEAFIDSIISIDKYVDLESDIDKITVELYKILG